MSFVLQSRTRLTRPFSAPDEALLVSYADEIAEVLHSFKRAFLYNKVGDVEGILIIRLLFIVARPIPGRSLATYAREMFQARAFKLPLALSIAPTPLSSLTSGAAMPVSTSLTATALLENASAACLVLDGSRLASLKHRLHCITMALLRRSPKHRTLCTTMLPPHRALP
jgi:hypothetical protein